jgi:hypothetical protein
MSELPIVTCTDFIHERRTEVVIALLRPFRFQFDSAAAELRD